MLFFLIPVVCSGSQKWLPPLVQAATSCQIHLMIRPAWSCVNHVCQSPTILSSVRTLPPDFITNLCYLACEQLENDPLPPNVSFPLFRTLSVSLATYVKAAFGSHDWTQGILWIRSPSVLEVALRGFLLMQDEPEVDLERHRALLSVLFAGYEKRKRSGCCDTGPLA